MKAKTKNILFTFLLTLLFVSCKEDIDTRTFFPHSTPVIESATITPTSFTYGDSLKIDAVVSDPLTPLSTLEVKVVANDQVIATNSFRTSGQNAEVSELFKTFFMPLLPNNEDVEVILSLINVEGDVTNKTIKIKGKRLYFDQLYLVLDNGSIINLKPQKNNLDKYESAALSLTNSIRYKVATKITEDNQIDFSGIVWGFKDGEIQVVDESGDYIETKEPLKKSTEGVIFDTYQFKTSLLGQDLTEVSSLKIENFTPITIDGETFKQASYILKKNQKIELDATLKQAIFNMDFFTTVGTDSIQFTGETGPWVLNYSATRKIVILESIDPSYPSALLACGTGLGYPSKAQPGATSNWGFDTVKKFILFKKIDDNIYQGTVYIDATDANFKFFENRDWANAKNSDDYSLPTILMNSADHDKPKDPEKPNGNWYTSPDAKSGNYKITIDLKGKTVTATAVTLP